MCQVDSAAAIAALTAAYPGIATEELPHPALAGCDDVAWSSIPGCPEGVPAMLRGLLDPDAAEEAARVLSLLVMSDPLHLSPVMPEDHPERSECRAAFAADATSVSRLLTPALPAEDELYDWQASLLNAAGL